GRKAPLPIGSVKSNLGHMEAASGMGGLLKTVLALKHGAVPGTLHLRQPNPNIDFRALNVCVPTQTTPLAASANRPRVAGVNSFGFGGANAHVLLCAPDVVRLRNNNSTSLNAAGVETRGSKAPSASDTATVTLPPLYLSAHCEPALRELAGRYADLIATLEGAKAPQSASESHSANATNTPLASADTSVSDTTAPTFYD